MSKSTINLNPNPLVALVGQWPEQASDMRIDQLRQSILEKGFDCEISLESDYQVFVHGPLSAFPYGQSTHQSLVIALAGAYQEALEVDRQWAKEVTA